MSRSPAAHRLATRKQRAERLWIRQTRRNYRPRYVTGLMTAEYQQLVDNTWMPAYSEMYHRTKGA